MVYEYHFNGTADGDLNCVGGYSDEATILTSIVHKQRNLSVLQTPGYASQVMMLVEHLVLE